VPNKALKSGINRAGLPTLKVTLCDVAYRDILHKKTSFIPSPGKDEKQCSKAIPPIFWYTVKGNLQPI